MAAPTDNSTHSGQMDASRPPVRLLIIDDDPKLCQLVGTYLEPLGFEVQSAHNGIEGLRAAIEATPDVILLDVMLPGMDGFDVLRGIREKSNVPVLMLTARGDEVDRVNGLETGADDYLPKTFSTRELLARLRAVLRRANPTEDPTGVFVNGPLSLKSVNRKCMLHGELIELTALEFDLLFSLIANLDRVRTREQLLNDVAGREYEVFDRSVDVHISSLRQKLGDNPKRPTFIRTIRSVGYLMIRH